VLPELVLGLGPGQGQEQALVRETGQALELGLGLGPGLARGLVPHSQQPPLHSPGRPP